MTVDQSQGGFGGTVAAPIAKAVLQTLLAEGRVMMAETSRHGTLIDGRYRVVSRLGSGGMADVFLAEDEQLGRKVALKLLHRRFAEDPGFVERFRREAQAAAGLQHPNVVSVYDRGAFDGTYYIAMEYLPGRSLKQLIREEAPLDPVRAIDITIQILKAARFAHRHGVIHRDLKPHNVIVDDTGHAKVTDFGIARAGASDMTETGSIMGTAQYLSPEQAQGHAVSAASDLYSVGVVLYEMLTGPRAVRRRVGGDDRAQARLRGAAAADRFNPTIPPELEQVVMWALNKNPADRPHERRPVHRRARAAKAAIRAGSPGERTASMAALAGVGVPVGGAGFRPLKARMSRPKAPPHRRWRRTRDPVRGGSGGPPPDEERQRSRSPWPWIALLLALLPGRRRRCLPAHAPGSGPRAGGRRRPDQHRADGAPESALRRQCRQEANAKPAGHRDRRDPVGRQ